MNTPRYIIYKNNYKMNILKKIKEYIERRNMKKVYKKRLEELKKRDPFVYKH